MFENLKRIMGESCKQDDNFTVQKFAEWPSSWLLWRKKISINLEFIVIISNKIKFREKSIRFSFLSSTCLRYQFTFYFFHIYLVHVLVQCDTHRYENIVITFFYGPYISEWLESIKIIFMCVWPFLGIIRWVVNFCSICCKNSYKLWKIRWKCCSNVM